MVWPRLVKQIPPMVIQPASSCKPLAKVLVAVPLFTSKAPVRARPAAKVEVAVFPKREVVAVPPMVMPEMEESLVEEEFRVRKMFAVSSQKKLALSCCRLPEESTNKTEPEVPPVTAESMETPPPESSLPQITPPKASVCKSWFEAEQLRVEKVSPPPSSLMPLAKVEVAEVEFTSSAPVMASPPEKVEVEVSPRMLVVAVEPTLIPESEDNLVVEALAKV